MRHQTYHSKAQNSQDQSQNKETANTETQDSKLLAVLFAIVGIVLQIGIEPARADNGKIAQNTKLLPSPLATREGRGMYSLGKPKLDLEELLSQQRYIEAAPLLDKKLKLYPIDAKLWFQYGTCCEGLNDNHGALGAYEMVSSLSPNYPNVKAAIDRMNLAVINDRERTKTISTLEKTKELKLQEIDSLMASKNLKDYGLAAKLITDLLATDACDSKLWYRLGKCKQGSCDYHGALAAYEMSSRLAPSETLPSASAVKIRSYLNGGSITVLDQINTSDIQVYCADVQRRIERAWYPPSGKSIGPQLEFTIDRQGKISSIITLRNSSSNLAEKAAIKSIENAAPFRPLPFDAQDSLKITISFNEGGNKKTNGSTGTLYLNQTRVDPNKIIFY